MQDKKWIVKMGDGKELVLTGDQMGKFREALVAGAKFLDFGEFGINLNFFERYWKIKDSVEPFPDHPEVEMSPEQRARNLETVREMAEKKGLVLS